MFKANSSETRTENLWMWMEHCHDVSSKVFYLFFSCSKKKSQSETKSWQHTEEDTTQESRESRGRKPWQDTWEIVQLFIVYGLCRIVNNNYIITIFSTGFSCPMCDVTFSTNGNRKLHIIYQHSIGKQFVCDVCAAAFRRKEALAEHIKRHNPPDTCEVCGRLVTDMKKHLYGHERAKRPPEMVLCPLCGKQFPKASLPQHIDNVHEKKPYMDIAWKCTECPESFTRQEDLRRLVYWISNESRLLNLFPSM